MARRRITEFFDYGSPFYTFGSWVFDLIVLNFLWLLTSGMAVIGLLLYLYGHTVLSQVPGWVGYGSLLLAFLFWCPATTAMYYTLSKKLRKHDTYMLKDYFRSYRENFRQAFVLGSVITFIAILLVYNYYLMLQVPNMFGGLTHTIQIMQIVIGAEVGMTAVYAVALLARLRLTLKQIITDAFAMANKHLPVSVLCAAILVGAFWLMYRISILYVMVLIVPVMLAIVALLENLVLVKYIEDEDELQEMEMFGRAKDADEWDQSYNPHARDDDDEDEDEDDEDDEEID